MTTKTFNYVKCEGHKPVEEQKDQQKSIWQELVCDFLHNTD